MLVIAVIFVIQLAVYFTRFSSDGIASKKNGAFAPLKSAIGTYIK